MKELVIDFAEVSDGRLPAGEWDLTIVSVKESKSANNDCLDFVFKEVNDEGSYFERIPLVENVYWRLQNIIGAAGFDPKGKYSISDLQQDLVGAVVRANIVIEPRADTGEDQPRAKSFSKIT